ncbi:MAG: hypothetical protein ACPGVB_08545 [Chitinophagales bacterium]
MKSIYKILFTVILLQCVTITKAQTVSFFSDPSEATNAAFLDVIKQENAAYDANCECLVLKKGQGKSYVEFVYAHLFPDIAYLKMYVENNASIFVYVNNELIVGTDLFAPYFTDLAFSIFPDDLTGLAGNTIRIELIEDSAEDLKLYMVEVSSDGQYVPARDSKLEFMHLPLNWEQMKDGVGITEVASPDGNTSMFVNTHAGTDVSVVEKDLANFTSGLGITDYKAQNEETLAADQMDDATLRNAKFIGALGKRNGEDVGMTILIGLTPANNVLTLISVTNQAGKANMEDLQWTMSSIVPAE